MGIKRVLGVYDVTRQQDAQEAFSFLVNRLIRENLEVSRSKAWRCAFCADACAFHVCRMPAWSPSLATGSSRRPPFTGCSLRTQLTR
jgi:hypothetical protein